MFRNFKDGTQTPTEENKEENNNQGGEQVVEVLEELNLAKDTDGGEEKEEKEGRNSRAASAGSPQPPSQLSASASSSSPQLSTRQVPPGLANMAMAFDMGAGSDRERPHLPSTEGIEYPRAASWASGTLTHVLNDDKGRQLFRCFLFDALAEENLNFLEAVDKLKKMKQNDEKQKFAREVVDCYSPYVNLSSSAMQKIKAAAESENPEPNEFAPACKEVRRLLENDQFPRFRRSDTYLHYLEELLPRSYAEKWATSFEALLGNHVGRQYFRLFLRSIHAEENLRFWEAVVEFRATKNKSPAMLNLARVILQAYLAEGQNNEVFLPFGVRQVIERKIQDKEVDISLFDEAIKHVEQVLRNDPYVRFLQSQEYVTLLSKLKN